MFVRQEMELNQYTCICCGASVKELCKKYSETVLKLTNCDRCKNVADKYVEYDIIIVIIDLILLRKEAYRHILYNTDFHGHWKLAVMLQMMEAYSEWILISKKKDNFVSYVYSTDDVQLYMLSFRVIFRTLSSLIIILLLTTAYNYIIKKVTNTCTFLKTVWKAMILANFGWFLLLPSLIWDNSSQEFHLTFVSLYTTLSQLLAYTVVCNCAKIWSIVVIVLAYSSKLISNEIYDILYHKQHLTKSYFGIKKMDSKRSGSYKNGYWMWDEVNNGLLFVSRDTNPRFVSQQTTQIMLKTNNPEKTKEIQFREIVDHLDQARFRRHYQRRCKPNEPEVVTVQDIKDITIYLANPNKLSMDFIKYFHMPTMDRFLRSLIVWETLLLRREEAQYKLYQPSETPIENRIRDDLSDLRVIVSREYSTILVGAEETRKFHHMLSNKNNVSLSDKDRKIFETLIFMCVRVVWIALHRKNLKLIGSDIKFPIQCYNRKFLEIEMNKMLRTDLFNSIVREQSDADNEYCPTPDEIKILQGQFGTTEKKLLHRSVTTKEIILGKHDYRLLVIGIKQFEPIDDRLKYLEIAISAPEELLLPNGVVVGLLGLPRSNYDAMLMNFTHSFKKQQSTKPMILPEFKLPPRVVYSDEKMPKAFPKEHSKYKDTQQTIRSRAKQLKMWKNTLQKIHESTELSLLELSGTQSQALLSSRSSISMATRQSVL